MGKCRHREADVTPLNRSPKRRAVFLDRDGTLNLPIVREGKPYPPSTLDEFRLYNDVSEACETLVKANYLLVVVTNQPDVGRGTQSQAAVEALNNYLHTLIPALARIEVCYAPGRNQSHVDSHRRKPAPGMLLDSARALNLDLDLSWMIGDRWGDIDAGYHAGCRTIFIDRNYTERAPDHAPDYTVKSLGQAASIILAQP